MTATNFLSICSNFDLFPTEDGRMLGACRAPISVIDPSTQIVNIVYCIFKIHK